MTIRQVFILKSHIRSLAHCSVVLPWVGASFMRTRATAARCFREGLRVPVIRVSLI